MLLIHDLGEIDVGDTIIYDSEQPHLKEEEAKGLERILKILPENQAKEYIALWREFEDGQSIDAQYARAIDRIPPLFHNMNDEGHSWNNHGVTKEQILKTNSRVALGSAPLWEAIKTKLNEAFDQGILK